MQLVIGIFFIVLIWFLFRCRKKEREISDKLEFFGVTTRLYTFINMSLFLAGCGAIIYGVLSLLWDGNILGLLTSLCGAAIVFFFGWKMYKGCLARCPEHLRKKLFGMMFMAAIGMGMRIGLFFLPMIASHGMKVFEAEDGNTYVVDGLDVRDKDGRIVGKYNPSSDTVTVFK